MKQLRQSKSMKSWSVRVRVVVFLLMIAGGLVGQGRCGPCSTYSAALPLISCREAVAPDSTIPPNQSCCNGVRTIGRYCLCDIVNSLYLPDVDKNLLALLPEKCNVPFDSCVVNGKERESVDAGSGMEGKLSRESVGGFSINLSYDLMILCGYLILGIGHYCYQSP